MTKPSLVDRGRKRKQVESAPKKSREAKLIKRADKTSNVRAVANSPAPDWGKRVSEIDHHQLAAKSMSLRCLPVWSVSVNGPPTDPQPYIKASIICAADG